MIKGNGRRVAAGILAAGTAMALALTGCSSDGGSTNGEEEKGTVRLALNPGWAEGLAVTELWRAVLTDEGYDVKLVEFGDPAPMFLGLADNDLDVMMDVWLPTTYGEYVDKYGDQIVDLGAWNEEAALTLVVNEDAPITSIAELADHADEFGNRIVGIEPGSSTMNLHQETTIPTYGLEKMELVASSTPAMLAELSAATEKGKNIVAVLWRPHWAYAAFPIRDLEDPEGALGGAEGMHSFGSTDFVKNFPEVADWLRNFTISSDQLNSLENVMFNENDGVDEYDEIIRDWMADNQDYVNSLTK